jgi:hypothetical protein
MSYNKQVYQTHRRFVMVKKSIALVLLLSLVVMLISGCVSAPKYSDYVGLDKHDAHRALQSKKTGNGIKLAFNWILWGWVGLWIPSIVDTIKVISFSGDFRSIETRIVSTPNGARVGQVEAPAPVVAPQAPAPVPPAPPTIEYSIMLNGQQMGPYNYQQLVQMVSSKQLTAQTLVWRAGMASWVAAGTVPELAQILASSTPPPPPPMQ